MAMEDIYSLLKAIARGSDIQKIDKTQDMITIIYAHIISATLHINHNNGSFEGSVNYQIEGESYVRIESLWKMWLSGWSEKQVNGSEEIDD